MFGGISISKNDKMYNTNHDEDNAILVGREKASVNELFKLAQTAELKIMGKLLHNTDKISPAYYIRTGKLNELKHILDNTDANLVIFDNELTPAQYSNLEGALNYNVIDRAQLILNIFESHAHTKESKLQVEKAHLEYMLPRLTGKGDQLSRLAGGIGTRGPGETKLEVDRRRINDRIHRQKQDLKEIKKNRETQRKDRSDPIVALVGYTNAGKSTLLNRLTGTENIVADKLFATLDSTLRKMKLPNGRDIILTDTIGFIRNLPHQLVASFQATLEEIKKADIILHIIDVSDKGVGKHIKVTNKVLKDLNVLQKEKILVFNKVDSIDNSRLNDLSLQYPEHVKISALNGSGEDGLINEITDIIDRDMVTIALNLPYDKAHWLEIIHNNGRVFEENYEDNHIYIKAKINKNMANKLKKYTA
jgi:GTP-binding protein HflX